MKTIPDIWDYDTNSSINIIAGNNYHTSDH